MELQEQDCFLERCHLERSQLHSLNLARTDSLPDVTELFNGYDAFFIGGAGEYSAVEEYDWIPFALDTHASIFFQNFGESHSVVFDRKNCATR
jgi:hypothetical protein